jgi:hypothetical protein
MQIDCGNHAGKFHESSIIAVKALSPLSISYTGPNPCGKEY